MILMALSQSPKDPNMTEKAIDKRFTQMVEALHLTDPTDDQLDLLFRIASTDPQDAATFISLFADQAE
ncbi:hypothetical protein FC07_GL001321 [Loigolactobacillus bifermentans DSM 20003]|uniref:Uncharacterized protein n=2 Tax=Loigolactobacillus bifermentans TaxID=1607 RepID=A0A0R1H2C8_9LACO|nr:hypothetical protein FC07_GL001321 [Loigolactobacillus bifermentans DSM 20003]